MKHHYVRRAPPQAIPIDPALYAHKLQVWIWSDSVPISALYTALDRREWPLPGMAAGDPPVLLRLEELAAVKRRLVERVAACGGEHKAGLVLLKSDGVNFSVTLSP